MEVPLKPLARILAGALGVFLALAIVQESDVFLRPWFQPRREPTLDAAAQKGAADAVGLYLQLTVHLYRSDGDRRFAERMPAAVPLVEETLADIRDLAALGLRRDPNLVRLEIGEITAVAPDRALVRTREFWVTRTLAADGSEAERPRSQVLFATYRVARDGPRWRVDGWDPDDPPAEGVSAPMTAGAPASPAAPRGNP